MCVIPSFGCLQYSYLEFLYKFGSFSFSFLLLFFFCLFLALKAYTHIHSDTYFMERIDSTHSERENPRPILVTPPSLSSSHHHARRSISGIDILNGLKIMTSSTLNNDSNMPPSPVPSQLLSEHHFSQIDDFEIKEAIGNITRWHTYTSDPHALFVFRLWLICYSVQGYL